MKRTVFLKTKHSKKSGVISRICKPLVCSWSLPFPAVVSLPGHAVWTEADEENQASLRMRRRRNGTVKCPQR